jgi:predicted small lipoprotein YifL
MADSTVLMAYSVSALTLLNLPMNKIRILLFLCIFALLTAACGQRGPLYLPQPDQQDSQAAEEGEEKDEKTSGA